MNAMLTTLLVLSTLSCTLCMWVKEMENKGAFEGDIILDPDEFEHGWNTSKEYASIKGGRWPGAVVPYFIGRSIGRRGVSAISSAIADYHRYTCIKWKKRTNERSYVSFYRGGGCSSPVGYRLGRVNRISLASGCWYKGTIMHEMGHTLGFYHEQSRPDRDSHVRILWRNIQQSKRYNFNKQPKRAIDSLGTPYDYASMMHYGSTAFAARRNSLTIQTIDPSKQRLIGQRQGFSKIDVKQLNLMYKCGGGSGGGGGGGGGGAGGGGGGGGSSCGDKHRYCASWARGRYCRHRQYIKYMSVNCRKSCNLC